MSKKDEYYRQCELQQEDEFETLTSIITWISDRGAKLGSTMELQDPITKKWKPGRWTVVDVGHQRLSIQAIKEHISATRNYRRATKI